MEKLILCLGSFLFFTATFAQQPKPPTVEERLNKLNELLQQDVKPTAAQKTGIENIFRTFFAAADKLRNNNQPPAKSSTAPPPLPDNVRAAMHQLEENRDATVQKLLTEAQYKKYKVAADKLRPPRPGNEKKNSQPPAPHK